MNASKDVEALRRGLGESSGITQPLVFTSAEAPEPGSPDFWSQSRELEDFRPLARAILDRVTGTGCLVAVADAGDDCAQRQFCALQIARLLNEEGKRVLLVDAQLDGRGFSRNFDEIESEGLIDLVQYGSSPMATVQPSPILGLWMMSAGSFRPEGELGSEALHRALGQLRATHEIVLLPLPTHQPSGFFSEFFVHVDGVLLGAANATRAELGEVIVYLRQHHVGLWGGVGYGSEEQVGEEIVESQLDERPAAETIASSSPEPKLEPKPEPEPEPERAATPPPAAPARETPARPAEPKSAAVKPARNATPPAESRARPEPVPKPKPQPAPESAPRRHPSAHGARGADDRSSPLFRRSLIAIVVAFVAFLGWWGATQFRDPAAPVLARPSISSQAAQQRESLSAADAVPQQETERAQEAATAEDVADAAPPQPTESDGAPELRDSSPERAREESSPPASQLQQGTTSSSETTAEKVVDSPVESSPPVAAEKTQAPSRQSEPEPEPAKPVEPTLSPLEIALRAEPGDGGWSLHLWSFRKTTEAEVAVRSLENEGLSPRIIAADLNELGLWYRVVVGRYESRGEAMRARSLMTGWPGVENVGLVRVP